MPSIPLHLLPKVIVTVDVSDKVHQNIAAAIDDVTKGLGGTQDYKCVPCHSSQAAIDMVAALKSDKRTISAIIVREPEKHAQSQVQLKITRDLRKLALREPLFVISDDLKFRRRLKAAGATEVAGEVNYAPVVAAMFEASLRGRGPTP